MKLYNTATRSIDEFTPLNPPKVTLYACGFTSYDYAHIGHARKYTNDDLLKRALTHFGYDVKHVMNITDVGHLVGDTDEGEDKMAKGARKYGKTVEEISDFFTEDFLKMLKSLNCILPDPIVKATDHIQDMIDLIKILEQKGFTYVTEEAVYFDTQKFEKYGALSGQKLEDKIQQAREEVHVDSEKKHPADFSLWFLRVGKHADHAMHWDSPWGDGFPGWHIECSAMSMKYLGETIDIHTGGIDHIPVHHENEIAQSECATGKHFVKTWFHTHFLVVDGIKMSKSLENFLTLNDVQERGYAALDVRYLMLQTHYRQTMNFTWEALDGAKTALKRLKDTVFQLKQQSGRQNLSEEKRDKVSELSQKFDAALGNDLQLPQALAVVWETIKSNIPSEDKLDLILEWDRVLGLQLDSFEKIKEDIPLDVIELAEKRKIARSEKKFEEADLLRKEITDAGFIIDDIGEDYTLSRST